MAVPKSICRSYGRIYFKSTEQSLKEIVKPGVSKKKELCTRLKFSYKTKIILIPYEDRKGEWMSMALDRYRFQRRIKNASDIISPVLEKHLQLICNHA